MQPKNYFLLSFLIFLSLSFHRTQAQDGIETITREERASPFAIATFKNEELYIKVTYSQPAKRGREVFGMLVPYAEVWRTGANEATEITFDKDVEINGKKVLKGTYSLFTIPGPDSWTFILNSDLGQWGNYSYNAQNNIVKVEGIPVVKLEKQSYESLTINLEEARKSVNLTVTWDQTSATLPIYFAK